MVIIDINILILHIFAGTNKLSARFVMTTIFTSNFIGIVFARTLHYQFYCWYFHTLPYLLWHCEAPFLDGAVKLALFVSIEVCFNVFPATWWSSALLQVRNSSVVKTAAHVLCGVKVVHSIPPLVLCFLCYSFALC